MVLYCVGAEKENLDCDHRDLDEWKKHIGN